MSARAVIAKAAIAVLPSTETTSSTIEWHREDHVRMDNIATFSSSDVAAVEFRNLTKHFGAVRANDAVSFSIQRGTVHGVIGENGAGKSTLMSSLFGLNQPDDGEILINGEKTKIADPSAAIRLGIGMVHQHFMLVERLSALDNIILGHEGGAWLGSGMRRARAKVEAIQARYSLSFPLDRPISDLPVGTQQRVEIVKSLYRGAKILILDEPTSVLTPQEVQNLFAVFRELAAGGNTVVLITHKLQEIVEVTSSVTVLRHGQVVATRKTASVSKSELAEMMVGRKLMNLPEARPATGEEVLLSVNDLSAADASGVTRIDGLSFEVRRAEILGIAGVTGNGQSELLSCLSGQFPIAGGNIRVGSLRWSSDRKVNPIDVRSAGVALVSEDRLRHSVITRWSASENSVLGIHRSGRIRGVGRRMRPSRLKAWCTDLMEMHDVRPADPARTMSVFSGGNQQKLVIARELATEPDIIIAGQPTRGVDVGAIEAIHSSLLQQRNAGKAILLVSVELEELMALADRILVMFEGRSMGILERTAFHESAIGLMMSGASCAEAIGLATVEVRK